MCRIKKHHTVPCSYLKGFVANIVLDNYRKSKIEVYDRKNNEFREQPIEDTTTVKNIYTIENEHGDKDDILERELGKDIDAKIGKIIMKIDNEEYLTSEDKKNLLLFVSFQKQRTYVDLAGYKETQKEFMKYHFMSKYQQGGKEALKDTFDKIGLKLSDEEIEKNYEFIISGEWDIKIINNSYFMKQMLEHVFMTYDFLTKFNFVIFKAPKNRFFITSDDPFCMLAPRENTLFGWGGVGFLTPGLEIHIPLSKKSCLFLVNSDKLKISGYYQIPLDLLRALNKRTCDNSYRYILGHNRKLIENILKQTGITGLGDFKHKISTPLGRSRIR